MSVLRICIICTATPFLVTSTGSAFHFNSKQPHYALFQLSSPQCLSWARSAIPKASLKAQTHGCGEAQAGQSSVLQCSDFLHMHTNSRKKPPLVRMKPILKRLWNSSMPWGTALSPAPSTTTAPLHVHSYPQHIHSLPSFLTPVWGWVLWVPGREKLHPPSACPEQHGKHRS